MKKIVYFLIYKKISYLLLFWAIGHNGLFAQNTSHSKTLFLNIKSSDTTDLPTAQRLIKPPFSALSTHVDTAALTHYLDTIIVQLQQKNYWAASIDSLEWQKDTCTAHFFLGKTYQWQSLENGNIDANVLAAVGFRSVLYQNQALMPQKIAVLKEKILVWAENHGYPFCSVWLETQTDSPTEGSLSAKIYWRKGAYFVFDKPIISGNTNVSAAFLEKYLEIERAKPYNEATIQRLQKRLSSLTFLEEKQPFSLEFVQERNTNKVRPFFTLKRKRASRFDVLVGFLPSTVPGAPLNITGNAELEFQNLFGGGQQFRLQWTQVRTESPEAKMMLKLPYLIGLPLGIDANFELYKRDTSYVDVRAEVGVNYLLNATNYAKVFWNVMNTNLLTVADTATIKSTRRLPDIIDLNNTGLGVEYHAENLDYRFSPRKGWTVTARGSVHLKTVRENTTIARLFDENTPNRFDYSTLYDSLRQPATQFRAQLNMAYYVPLGERNVAKIAFSGGSIFGSKSLYRNEQFRIGGAKSLRGFSEETLFSTTYGIATLEYRFLLAQNSYLFAFFDQAYNEDVSVRSRNFDRPSGFGGGLTLETAAGIFGLTIAFGQQQQSAFDFNAAKVHLGYVNLF